MAKVNAQAAARKAMELAAREIDRLAISAAELGTDGKPRGLVKFEGFDLQRYADICLRYDDHELKWMSKLDPSALPAELVERVTRLMEGEADGAQRAKRSKRSAA